MTATLLRDLSETEYPEGPPEVLYKGGLWYWKRVFPDLPDSTGYILEYVLTPQEGGTSHVLTALNRITQFTIKYDGDYGGDPAPGIYYWQERLSKALETGFQTTEQGALLIRPDQTLGTEDPRTDSQKMLDAINSLLAGRVDDGVQAFSIRGRSITALTLAELMDARAIYQQLVAEENKENTSRFIYARM